LLIDGENIPAISGWRQILSWLAAAVAAKRRAGRDQGRGGPDRL